MTLLDYEKGIFIIVTIIERQKVSIVLPNYIKYYMCS